jgi:drug/metabolite transporter (DMT)-like permease
VTAVVIGVSVFGERLTPREIIGLAAIIAAVTAVIAAPRMSLRLSSVKRMFPRIPRRRQKR